MNWDANLQILDLSLPFGTDVKDIRVSTNGPIVTVNDQFASYSELINGEVIEGFVAAANVRFMRITGDDEKNRIDVSAVTKNDFPILEVIHVIGQDDNDTIDATNSDIRTFLEGREGKDTITGGLATNQIFGNSGNDTLIGGPSVDTIDGGDGTDYIYGNGGNDSLFGDIIIPNIIPKDEAHIYELGQPDFIFGGIGSDEIIGNGGGDQLFGGGGTDLLSGMNGEDTIHGGTGCDTFAGGLQEDNLNGDTGDDVMFDNDDTTVFDGGTGRDETNGIPDGDAPEGCSEIVASSNGFLTSESGGDAIVNISLSNAPAVFETVIVAFSSTDTSEGRVAPAALVFDATNWNTPQAITITGQDDTSVDGDIDYQIIGTIVPFGFMGQYAESQITLIGKNLDNEILVSVSPIAIETTEDGGQAAFDIVLTRAPSADVTIPLTNMDPSEGTLDVNSVTFTPTNWNQRKTVTVDGIDDGIADGDQVYVIRIDPAQSADSEFNGAGPLNNVIVTNYEENNLKMKLTPSTQIATTEGGGATVLSLALLEAPNADVTIPLSITDATEASISVLSLTFGPTNWSEPQDVVVTGLDDDVDDSNIAYQITLGAFISSDPEFAGHDPADINASNFDDDNAGIIVSSTGSLWTSESGGLDTFSVSLTTEPVNDVTVSLGLSDSSVAQLSTLALSFTPSNWAVPQLVTVTGLNDGLPLGDVSYYVLVLPASSVDPAYNGLDHVDLIATNLEISGPLPVTVDDNAITNQDTSAVINVLANDSHPDLLPLTVSAVGTPGDGTTSTDGTTVTYTPSSGYTGSDSFDYIISDGAGGFNSGTVYITVNSINHSPIAIDDSVATPVGMPMIITVLANDYDSDADLILIESVDMPSNGSAQNFGTFVLYTPDPAFTGTDSFNYQIRDVDGGTATATVTITVTPDNSPPQGYDDTYEVLHDTTIDSVAQGFSVLDNDFDLEGDSLSAILITSVSEGTLLFNADGSFTYDPMPGRFDVSVQFTYLVIDSVNASNIATVTIDVTNTTPQAMSDWFYTDVNTPLDWEDVLSNDWDMDGDSLAAKLISGPSYGLLTYRDDPATPADESLLPINPNDMFDGTFVYWPNPNMSGNEDSFIYRATDGLSSSDDVQVTIWVDNWQYLTLDGPPNSAAIEINPPTLADVELLTGEAVRRWQLAGADVGQLTQIIGGLQIHIVNMPGSRLGAAAPGHLLIDRDAAGYGWFVDATPANDAEFSDIVAATELRAATLSAADGKVDLLTLITHELGHHLGLIDMPQQIFAHHIMTETISLGTRRTIDDVHQRTAPDAPQIQPASTFWQQIADGFQAAAAADPVAAMLATQINTAITDDLTSADLWSAGVYALIQHGVLLDDHWFVTPKSASAA